MRIKLDLNKLSTLSGESISAFLIFNSIDNRTLVNFNSETYPIGIIRNIAIYDTLGSIDIESIEGDYTTFTQANMKTLSLDETTITFTARSISSGDSNVNPFVLLQELINLEVVSLEIEGNTSLYTYKLNSENNELNKSLTFVSIIQGKFNHSIAVKLLDIDVINYEMGYNYILIPSLKRYYYIDSIEIVSADITRLHLKEDVLMSWQALIKRQDALITRQQYGDNRNLLIDNRLPLEDRKSHQYFSSLIHGLAKNITFDYSTSGKRFCSLSFTTASQYLALINDITPPVSNSGLPTIKPHMNYQTCMAFFPYLTLYNLIKGIYADSTKASYIENLMWLPFDPLVVFSVLTEQASKLYVGDKILGTLGDWNDPASTDVSICQLSQTMGSPYLVLADFVFSSVGGINVSDNILMRMSYWEIYVPFVGWVNVDFSKVFGYRIWIYYTMDMKTGISTAYIYNYSQKVIIYSTTCTLGIKVDFTTSNQLENTRQKQANDLNMLISGLSSALSIGVGAFTENPVAVAGGVLSLGKSIASYVNSNNMIFERANTSFGTSDGALYSPLAVSVRRTYHAPITIDSAVYGRMQGYPTNKYGSLSSLTGYVEIGEIHFNPKEELIYQDEITEIISLLKDGVIF